MKEEQIRSVLGLLLVLSLGACVALSPSHHLESDQPEETSTLEMSPPTPSLLQPSLTPTDSQSKLQLPSNVSVGEITYISNRSGMAEIWLLDLTTGLERRLTETDCSGASSGGRPDWYIPGVQNFSWAPDGRRIAYLATCNSGAGPANLNVIDLEVGRVISITGDLAGSDSHPSWKHSDRFIFSRRLSVYEPVECVYIAAFSERGVPKVEPLPGARWKEEQCQCYCPYWPTWSPNGKYVAYGGPYVGVPGAGSRAYVSIVDAEGNHMLYEPARTHPIPEHPNVRDSSWMASPIKDGLAWSNNSRYLAIASAWGDIGDLRLVEVVDRVAIVRSWLYSQNHDQFGKYFYSPVFSHDDETLYFVSVSPDIDPLPNGYFGAIYSVPVQNWLGVEGWLESKSLNIQVVSSLDQLAGYPSLSSDGKWFTYAVKVEGTVEIWLQATDGTYRQRLVGDGFVNTRPAWRPLDR